MPVDMRFHIHHAAEALNVSYLKRWLAKGANPNLVGRLGGPSTHRGKTPLLILCNSCLYASKEDEAVACAAALIEAGADVNFRSDDGDTPLLLAAWRAMPRVVAMLIAAGADVTSTGQAALAAASYCSDEPATRNAVRVVSMLIDAGVSVRGKRLDKLLPRLDEPWRVGAADDRAIAHLLRAGAALPHTSCAKIRRARGKPYLWHVSQLGGYAQYERKCIESLTAMLTPKFPQLPEALIPTIVQFAFHPGMYVSTGVPVPPAIIAQERFVAEMRDALAENYFISGSKYLGRKVRVTVEEDYIIGTLHDIATIRGWRGSDYFYVYWDDETPRYGVLHESDLPRALQDAPQPALSQAERLLQAPGSPNVDRNVLVSVCEQLADNLPPGGLSPDDELDAMLREGFPREFSERVAISMGWTPPPPRAGVNYM